MKPAVAPAAPAPTRDAHRADLARLDQVGAGPSAVETSPASSQLPAAADLSIKVGLVTAVADGTAINFAVTNHGDRPLTMLIVRCNAITASGAAAGQAFDSLHNVDVGETVYGQALFLKQTIASRNRFACRTEDLSQ